MIIPFGRRNSVFLNPGFSEAENVLELRALAFRKKINLVSAFKSMPKTSQNSYKHDTEHRLAAQQSYLMTRHYRWRLAVFF
jgi:hypothetical protein